LTGRTLYLVTRGAPLAARAVDGVHEARARGWDTPRLAGKALASDDLDSRKGRVVQARPWPRRLGSGSGPTWLATPAWLASIAVLRYAGVTIVDPTTGAIGSVEPLSSGSGEHVAGVFQWSRDVTRPPLDTQAK